MGIEVAAGLAVVGAVVSIKQGIDARKNADLEADLIEDQAANEERRRRELAEDVVESQKGAIIASGGLLEGSPLLILEETRRKSEEELDNLRNASSRQAAITRQRGRQAFTGGILGAATSAFNILAPAVGD